MGEGAGKGAHKHEVRLFVIMGLYVCGCEQTKEESSVCFMCAWFWTPLSVRPRVEMCICVYVRMCCNVSFPLFTLLFLHWFLLHVHCVCWALCGHFLEYTPEQKYSDQIKV